MSKTIPISILRGLLKEQNGKCAISGRKLNPNEVQGDHIIPLSRKELNPTYGKENVWLVSSEINRIKHNLSYKELVNACREILNNEKRRK